MLKLKTWREDALLLRVLKHSSLLLQGHVFVSLMSFISLAVAARGLGAAQMGVLVLVTSYVMMIDRVLNFQSWQALIKYGAEALAGDAQSGLRALMRLGFWLDVASALIRVLLAWVAAPAIGNLLGWDAITIQMAQYYSLIILSFLSGMPLAGLRLLSRFSWIALGQAVGAATRLLLLGLCFWQQASLTWYLAAWGAGEVITHAMVGLAGIIIMHRHGMLRGQGSLSRGIAKKFLHFIGTTSMITSVRSGTREVDTLIVGAVLGPASVALYHIVKQSGNLLLRLTEPLYQSLYPEFSRLAADRKWGDFQRLLRRGSLITGGVGIVTWAGAVVTGYWGLTWVFGPTYTAAYVPLLIYLFATAMAVGGFLMQPAMLALGKPGMNLRILFIATALYLPFLYVITTEIGLEGAGIAYIFFYCLWSGMMYAALRRTLKQEHACLPANFAFAQTT